MNKPKILFYDIETGLLKLVGFQLGKQVTRSSQLLPLNQITPIIMIQYCWNNNKKGKAIVLDSTDEKKLRHQLGEFDKLIKEADIVIGKNNTGFDNKHLNIQRLLHSLPAMPDWILKSDDLETQFRKHFRLPSQSLDYYSQLLGLKGKIKMEFQDWVDIHCYSELVNLYKYVNKKYLNTVAKYLYGKPYKKVVQCGLKALKKMEAYGIKDVEDTRAIWVYAEKHIRPKFNAAMLHGKFCCTYPGCGSTDLIKNGKRYTRVSTWQVYHCKKHKGYAGKAPISTAGRIGQIR